MAHVRLKFVDVYRTQGSAIADETIKRIAQLYAVEKAKSEARKLGHSVTEQQLEDGSIKLQILAGV